MNTENLSTLKINKLTQAQYDRALEAGKLEEYALYLTPEEAIKDEDVVLSNSVSEVYSGNTVKDALEKLVKKDIQVELSSIPSGEYTQYWESVAYGNGKFVAVEGSESGEIAYSEDGINWTKVVTGSYSYWTDVIFADGKFVAVGYNPMSLSEVSTYATGTLCDACMYSTDGISWSPVDSLKDFGENWASIVYGDGKYIAFDITGGIAAVCESINDWTGVILPTTTSTPLYGAYGNGKFVAVGKYELMYSSDGESWTYNHMGASCTDIAFGNGKFVAVADDGYICWSNDGVSWNPILENDEYAWSTVTYGDDGFIALTYNKNIIGHSKDGIIWEYKEVSTSNSWSDIAYGDGKYVAVVGYNEYLDSAPVKPDVTCVIKFENTIDFATKYQLENHKHQALIPIWPDLMVATIDDYHWNVNLEGNTSLYPFIPFSQTLDELPSMVYLKLSSRSDPFGKLNQSSSEPSVDMFIWYNKATNNFDTYMIGKYSTNSSTDTEKTYGSFTGYKSNLNKRSVFDITAKADSDIWTGDFGWLMTGKAVDAMMRVNIEYIYYDTTGIHMTWRNQYDGHQYTTMKCNGCAFK